MTIAEASGLCASAEVDLAAQIDARPVTPFQIRVALLCAAVLLLDAFDSLSLGFVAPRLSSAWHLLPGGLGPAFASGFLGQLLGAVIAGPVADRVGRKSVLVAGVAEFGLGTLAMTQAHSLESLIAFRLIAGFGLGASAPNAVALTMEMSPSARRSTLLVVVFCGIIVGALAAGGTAALLLPHYGWTCVFWAGGAAPIALAPALAWGLAESPYLLALEGGRDGEIAGIFTRMYRGALFPVGSRFIIREERATGISVKHLFSHGRAIATILLWVLMFMSNFEIYLFASWLPSLARASGLTEHASVLTGIAMNAGGLAGTLAMGWLLDRFSIERMMAVLYAAAAVFVAALALVSGDRRVMDLFSLAVGFCIFGGQMSTNALIAYRHPTYIRSTALSWALGAGRIASIVSPLGAGWVMSLGWTSRATFMLAIVPALCASAAVWSFGEYAGPREGSDGVSVADAATSHTISRESD